MMQTISEATAARRVLVAGVGNVLRGDDGFGPAVARLLEEQELPPDVRVVELGIGGINLVRELMDVYDALVIVDVVDRGGEVGTLYLLEPEVPDVNDVPAWQRHRLSDLHQAAPGRSLLLAQAASLLPPRVRIVGCQPALMDDFSMELSPAVARAVPKAAAAIQALLSSWRNERHET